LARLDALVTAYKAVASSLSRPKLTAALLAQRNAAQDQAKLALDTAHAMSASGMSRAEVNGGVGKLRHLQVAIKEGAASGEMRRPPTRHAERETRMPGEILFGKRLTS